MDDGPPQSLPKDVPSLESLSPADASALSAADKVNAHRLNVLSTQNIDLSHQFHNVASSSQTGSTVKDTMSSWPSVSTRPVQFRSNTIAPSPPLPEPVSEDVAESDETPYRPSPLGNGAPNALQITTDSRPNPPARTDSLDSNHAQSANARSGGLALQHKTSSSNLKPIARTPSFKAAFANSIGSACSSAVPSPILSALALGEVTPLPSPLLPSESPGPWARRRPSSRDASLSNMAPDSVLITATGESVASVMANQSKRKSYGGLKAGEPPAGEIGAKFHGRNRSISEYIPDPVGIPKRHITVSGNHAQPGDDHHLRREPRLAEARGLVPAAKPPTPPPSESSQSNDGSGVPGTSKKPGVEYFEAHGRHDKKLRRWRSIKKLGEGTFSRVMLATSQVATDESTEIDGSAEPDLKTLVAVKVCESGPRGGASEMRIEMSLKRELEIMQSIHHPSLVHLKAWNIEPTRAILVLSYCPGGDLFDFATIHRDLLVPSLLRRMFAELVAAVQYLHERWIVHRDIKLENVLVNLPVEELAQPNQDWQTYPESIITLTDLGLSRRVADDEKLETRCGSDDYAAPEVVLGQQYDGRATDAWSMGVLLYALLESRLPFDPPPGARDAQRMAHKTKHRIARIDWAWVEYAGDDGDHDGNHAKFESKGLKGAMEITEGLLKRARNRWTIEKVAETEWVKGGIQVEGGLKFKEEEEGEEVL